MQEVIQCVCTYGIRFVPCPRPCFEQWLILKAQLTDFTPKGQFTPHRVDFQPIKTAVWCFQCPAGSFKAFTYQMHWLIRTSEMFFELLIGHEYFQTENKYHTTKVTLYFSDWFFWAFALRTKASTSPCPSPTLEQKCTSAMFVLREISGASRPKPLVIENHALSYKRNNLRRQRTTLANRQVFLWLLLVGKNVCL